MISAVIFDISLLFTFSTFISIKNCESLEYEMLFIHNLYNVIQNCLYINFYTIIIFVLAEFM